MRNIGYNLRKPDFRAGSIIAQHGVLQVLYLPQVAAAMPALFQWSDCMRGPPTGSDDSAQLSRNFNVYVRRRNTRKSGQHRSDSLCAGLRVQCRVFWVWFGPPLGQNPARNRRFPAGSLEVFGALSAQLRQVSGLISVDSCTFFRAGAVGNGPGPNFGQKPFPNRPNLKPRLFPDILRCSIELPGRKSSMLGVQTAPSYHQNSLEKVGGFAPHLFQWALR